MRVLVIEDSVRLQDALARSLRHAGFAVDLVGDGKQGLVQASHNEYDAVVLDLMLPGLDGLELLRQLRARGSKVHVLILTARDAVEDRVKGLQAGADDYLIKPFAMEELVARLKALVRRAYGSKAPLVRVGDLEIDTTQSFVRCRDQPLTLTRREFRLLEYLVLRAGQTTSRIDIEDHLYGANRLPNSNAVESALSILRGKLARAGSSCRIATRHGLGYVLEVETP
jgi:DNA-binding response OmpR family regulator